MAVRKVDAKTERALEAYLDLVDVVHSLEAFLSRPLTPAKLTLGQFRVLATLLHSGPQSQRALIEKHFRTEGNASSALAILEKRGLIVRRGHEGDKRQWVVHLSPEGHALIARIFPRHANLVRAQMAALNGREQIALRKLCQKLIVGDPLKFISELTLVDSDEH
jgi:MarR family 2-MHQ and catechol resistance regulon transcriptional repressor